MATGVADNGGRRGWLTAMLALTLSLMVLAPIPAAGIYLQGTETSYARFPKWDACTNATFSFEFRTTQSEGLLMYADDGGKFDFFQMMHTGGRIRFILNIVNGRDGRVQIDVGRSVNDGGWHRVEIRRHRMETTLVVDGVSDSRSSFGSDFNFGSTEANSEMFIGGLPNDRHENIHQLALPSALYKSRFRGSIRNVIYGNCTCQRTRGRMLEGVGVTQRPLEACDVRNPCRRGCLCVSTDTEPSCDCTELKCVTDVVTHYSLPMDLLMGTTLLNPSGLDASAFGSPDMVRGVVGQAIRLDGRNSYVRVTGPGHRQECFGDLDKCPSGYTLAFWVNFEKPSDREVVYLSNGGHSLQSHGVAMLYDKGNMEFRFRKKNGQEWRVKHDDVLPGRWYHVSVTWSATDGLSLYLNGELVNSDAKPIMRSPRDVNTDENNEFMIGRPNDGTHVRDSIMLVDEFNFWSEHMAPKKMRNLGAIYGYNMPMESMRRSRITDTKLSTRVHGNPVLAPGKIGQGLLLDGRGEYVDAGDLSDTCLGNLSRCQYGFTFGTWIIFNELLDNMYYFSSGAPNGVQLYHRTGRLYAEAQQDQSNWRASWPNVQTGKWYFVELSWSPDDGLRMFVDLDEVAHTETPTTRRPTEGDSGQLMIGRANSDMRRRRYGAAIFDEMEVWNANRDRLVELGFINRGRPNSHIFNMDKIDRKGLRHRDASYNVRVFGDARIVPGKIEGGLRLDGNTQYVDADYHAGDCMGNLDLCRQGALASLWVKPAMISEKMQLISTGVNGLAVWYAGGKLHATAKTSTREWQVSTDKFRPTQWQYLEFAWDPISGLQIYVNNQMVATSGEPKIRNKANLGYIRQPEMNRFYLGRGDGSDNDVRYANVTMDEMEYWHLNRDDLIAFDYILRGKPDTYLLDMNKMHSNKLPKPESLDITIHGRPELVPGKRDKAIQLDGNGQYLDLGQHPDSCLGNLTQCHHGTTGSMWANFKDFNQNTYYYTNGNGVAVYYKDDKLHYSFTSGNQRWEVAVPDLDPDRWYFLEYTWHPEKGLRVYVNNRLQGVDSRPDTVSPAPDKPTNHVYVGRANRDDVNGRNFRFPDVMLDDVETWYADRDYLVAFGYLVRDNITHIRMPLEDERNGHIVYRDITVQLHHGAEIVRGKMGNGIRLDGNRQYLTLGKQGNSCFGNLEMCTNGLTMAFYLYLQRLVESGYIVSAGPYSIYSKDGRVHFKYGTPTKTWETSTDQIQPGRWQKVTVSWDETTGLQVFVDGRLVTSTTQYRLHAPQSIRDENVYIGRPNRVTPGRYGDFTIDEMEVWYANIDHLKAFDLIDKGITHVWFDMNRINGSRLDHSTWTVYVHGRPTTQPGIDGNAIYLNGRGQYIDFGRKVFCDGDPETSCSSGFTLSFEVKPHELQEDSYFVSSAPVDVYYRNGRLTTDVRTPTKRWTASTNRLDPDAWYKVDVSWHPRDGLRLYVNGIKVDERTSWTVNRNYDENSNFYFGRANTNMVNENYANTLVDNIELWYAKRDYLVDRGLVDRYFTPTPEPVTRRPLVTRPWFTRPPVTQPQRVTLAPWVTRYAPRTTERPIMPQFPSQVDDQRMLVFDGNSWVLYDYSTLSSRYLHGDKERFHVKFKTDKPDGLLWYSGTDQRNMHLSLEDAALILVVEYNDGRNRRKDRFRLRPSVGRLDDSNWHNVFINRDGRKVTLTVDGEEHDYPHQLDDQFRLVNRGHVYLGGSNNTYTLTGRTSHTNLRGSVEVAKITGDGFPTDIDLVNQYLTRPRPYYVYEGGNIRTRVIDRTAPRPVTFTKPESYVRLRKLHFNENGQISLRFKTIEPNGLLLFCGGPRGSGDFLALEMFDGIVYFVVNFGNGVHRYPLLAGRPKVKRSRELAVGRVDDGLAHHIQIKRSQGRLTLSLDDTSAVHRIPPGDNRLNLATFLYVGGVDNPGALPWYLWTRGSTAKNFFVGCLWDLRVNPGDENDIVDLPAFIKSQGIVGMEEGCQSMMEDCAVGPCANGICHDRATGYFCDCAATPYTSTRCNILAKKVGFNGRDNVQVIFNPMIRTHTNDISLRFKTVKTDGLLFSTSNRFQHDFMRVSLEGGRGKLETYIAGEEKIHYFCDGLSDDEWHTMFIKRRADYIEAWVDDCPHVIGSLPGDGYTLDIHDISVASLGVDTDFDKNFVGHMQNFFFDKYNFFELIGDDTPGSGVRVKTTIHDVASTEKIMPVNTVTFRSRANAYVTLPTLSAAGSLDFKFMFKTKEKEGLLFYNDGRDNDFLAIELVNGYVHLALNDGSGSRLIQVGSAKQLNDDEWHLVSVKQSGPHNFEVRIDNEPSPTNINIYRSDNQLELTGELYVGGVPRHMYASLPTLVSSRNSFAGCLATIRINGKLYNIFTDTITTNRFVTAGCTGASVYCGDNTCSRYGVCREGFDTFICDCNMTSFVGRICTEEAEGYRFSRVNEKGIVIYTYDTPIDTSTDRLAFGFMTWHPNGTIFRADSATSADYIEGKLENGYLVMLYDIGNGQRRLVEKGRKFDDGQYHYVSFVRTGANATMRVDDFPRQNYKQPGTAVRLFNELAVVKVGGKVNINDNIYDYFDGIIAGVYFNGVRIIDRGIAQDVRVTKTGDVSLAKHRFNLPQPVVKTPTKAPVIHVVPTPKPEDPVIVVPDKPAEVLPGGGKPSEGGGGPPGGGVLPGDSGGGVAEALVVDGGVSGGSGEGARAAAIAGAFLGILAAASGIMWAGYKLKPGLLGGGGGGSRGGGGGTMNISSPSAGSYQLVSGGGSSAGSGAAASGGGGAAKFGGGGGGASYGSVVTRMDANGAMTTGMGGAAGNRMSTMGTQTAGASAGGGGASANFVDYFSSMSAVTASGGGGTGIANYIGGLQRITRAAQTDLPYYGGTLATGYLTEAMAMNAAASGGMVSSTTTSYYQQDGMAAAAGGGYGTMDNQTIVVDELPPPTLTRGMNAYDSQTMAAGSSYIAPAPAPVPPGYNTYAGGAETMYNFNESQGYGSAGGSVSSAANAASLRMQNLSPVMFDSSASYTMQNVALNNAAYNQRVSMHGGTPVGLMAAEEIRVDCVLLSSDSRNVVTSSIYGPPQVWDMRTGELTHIMAGENLSSTDLHLACNDTLLVGQVAEMTQIDPTDTMATNRLHHRKLQIWDFASGQPLDMPHSETCTASCLMNDGQRIVLARTEKFGNGTTILLWDLLGNELIRQLSYDSAIGFADAVSYLTISKDNRYVVAGFQNSYDGNANFVVFDLSRDPRAKVDAKILALDANVDCTTVLDNHEVVTGTRKGELTIWSMRTGKQLRQLVAPPSGYSTLQRSGRSPPATMANAHTGEVKAVQISRDGRFLVSASADTTLKIWNLETEKLSSTLKGHTDEVWCCTISSDDDMVVSGSRDGTIRLWKSAGGQLTSLFNAGVDIFSVRLSSDKRTIVALGDKFAARKLVMLQIVHTKTKSHAGGSRATSPMPLHY